MSQVKNVFSLVGSTKVFPCLSMSPFPVTLDEEESLGDEGADALARQIQSLARASRTRKEELISLPDSKIQELYALVHAQPEPSEEEEEDAEKPPEEVVEWLFPAVTLQQDEVAAKAQASAQEPAGSA